MDEYTPTIVSAALRGGGDTETLIDVKSALSRLDPLSRSFLEEYGKGYSPRDAGKRVKLGRNGQEWFKILVRRIAQELNGGD